jgi:hypothetical protein
MIFFLYAWKWVGDEHRRFSAKIVELQVSLLVFSSPDPKGISSPLFSIFGLAAILDGSRDHRTQF